MAKAESSSEEVKTEDEPTKPTSEEVDISSSDEPTETDVFEELENDTTSWEDGDTDDSEEPDTSESETEEQDTAPAESEETDDNEPESESEDEEESSQEESEDESSDQSEEDTKSDTKSDTKKHNAEMAQRRIAERRKREQLKAEQQRRYLQDAEDDKDLALRQLQIDAYNNNIEKNVNRLENDLEKAASTIELFRTGSPEVKEELLRRADDFERNHVRFDDNGDPVNVDGSLYQYLKTEADSIQRILNSGARQQTKAKRIVKSRAETLPTRAPKEPKEDPDIAAFNKEFGL